MNVNSTVNGIANINVGTSDTRATNHAWVRNSRHANGGLNIATNVSSAIAKKPPTARTGLVRTGKRPPVNFPPPKQTHCLRKCCELWQSGGTPMTVHHRFLGQQQDRDRGVVSPRKAYERLLPGR